MSARDRVFRTPREAVLAMRGFGALFKMRVRGNGSASFTFNVQPGGDIASCRAILDSVKTRSSPYREAFKEQVAEIAERVSS